MAADISAFPTIRNVLISGDNINTYTAGEDIKAGQVVAFADDGVSWTVHPAIKATTAMPIGVALYSVDSGEEIAVAGPGCIVNVANFHDTTTIDAGDGLEPNDNAVGGTVNTLALLGSLAILYVIGYAVEDIGASGTGAMLVNPHVVIDAAS